MIRRFVGYARYDPQPPVSQWNALDAVYRLSGNHGLPGQKLVPKIRTGSKVKTIDDPPKTPYQRVLDSPEVSAQAKRKLRALHAALKLVELKRLIDRLREAVIPSRQQ